MIPRLAADWILPFIRTDSNRDFYSIMIPSSVAIEIENGGDFATFLGEEAFIRQEEQKEALCDHTTESFVPMVFRSLQS